MKRIVLALALIMALLVLEVSETQFTNLAIASPYNSNWQGQNPPALTIKPDGSIDPSIAPIQRNGGCLHSYK